MAVRFRFVALLLLMPVAIVQSGLERREFTSAAPQGFGDRQNSWAWAMASWNGDVYVGTNRAYDCVMQWELAKHVSPTLFPYPPNDPDVECAPNPADLALQAEIWRWSRTTRTWTRVYQSPNDVPNPDQPGKFLPRDNGFRTMTVFKEANGVEALYVGGITTAAMWDGNVPPPRILRSTDGVTFEPLPQDEGTFLAGLPNGSIRSLTSFNGKLFAIHGTVQGAGVVIASSDPALGNDAWSQVTSDDLSVFELHEFNGWLYAGIQDLVAGYAVAKTRAEGSPPYTFQAVVTSGGYLPSPSNSILSMTVHNNRLIAGSAAFQIARPPTEILRIDSDDHWDLLVGEPRQTPFGYKYPLSGLGDGFENGFNDHIWRMQSHDGELYVGTYDSTADWVSLPGLSDQVRHLLGFDMYRTSEGWYYHAVSLNGFGDRFNFGVRNFASTPAGLFVGSANPSYGLRLWRGDAAGVPLLPSPERLEAEVLPAVLTLSWEPVAQAIAYRLYRTPLSTITVFPELLGTPTIPGTPTLEATVTEALFRGPPPATESQQLYFVVAEDAGGRLSAPSNVVRVPSFAPPTTFGSVAAAVDQLGSRRLFVSQASFTQATDAIRLAGTLAARGRVAESAAVLANVRAAIDAGQVLQAPYGDDLGIPLYKLERRLRLVARGVLSAGNLR